MQEQVVDRTRRVAAVLRDQLAVIITRELNDRRINSVSLTGVSVSRDLKQATVFVSSVDSTTSAEQVEKLLNNAAKYLRRQLSQQVNLRVTPALLFKYDHSIAKGIYMQQLIDELNRPRNSPAAPHHGE